MGHVVWTEEAIEDLNAIYDPSVQAEVMDLAERELLQPSSPSPIEGRLPEAPDVYYRRAVKRSGVSQYLAWSLGDSDEFSEQAEDYVIVYRRITVDEKINLRRVRQAFVVVRVLHNRDLVLHFKI
jgi:hypothetical protein